MTHALKTALLALTGLCLAAGSSLAQTTDRRPADPVDQLLPPSTPMPAEEAEVQAGDAGPDPTEARITRALNDEIVSRNQLVENQERADRAAYEAERARYQAVVEQATRDRLAYEEAARQWEVERARAEDARSRYAADVLACRAGDRGRCPR